MCSFWSNFVDFSSKDILVFWALVVLFWSASIWCCWGSRSITASVYVETEEFSWDACYCWVTLWGGEAEASGPGFHPPGWIPGEKAFSCFHFAACRLYCLLIFGYAVGCGISWSFADDQMLQDPGCKTRVRYLGFSASTTSCKSDHSSGCELWSRAGISQVFAGFPLSQSFGFTCVWCVCVHVCTLSDSFSFSLLWNLVWEDMEDKKET